MKKIVTVLVALVLTMLAFNSHVSAEEGISLTEEDYSKITQQMKEDVAFREDINKVIAKLKNGERLLDLPES
ncbi:hypothetical protein SAMN04489762_1722 [Terribacillus saccharophilus]|uniref:Uncharacterized protein n=1 Tax=Terribacillus saccharophilus TaxID=361277 RepID=A0AAX2EEZ8_9BACI|nr:hypothetical protein [Terribacillus saccharophilus]MCM3226455.1 hypothetical protein [Terribacillus saccharophilus]SEN21871.1 hypothetical protein SAMN04489762_1722 [Terribacillus saccharophilus]